MRPLKSIFSDLTDQKLNSKLKNVPRDRINKTFTVTKNHNVTNIFYHTSSTIRLKAFSKPRTEFQS